MKANNWKKGDHDRHLGVLLTKFPIDYIVEKKQWYHLDKMRNKLYHEQYITMWNELHPDE